MKRNRPVRTNLGAVAALCASLQKEYLVGSARGTQPISPYRGWSRSFRHNLLVLGKFFCRFGNGHYSVFEKVATPVLRIGSHSHSNRYMTPSARSL
jgi:hypothetical protein